MIVIKKKRIRGLSQYLSRVPEGTEIAVGISHIDRFKSRLIEIGFTAELSNGETVLPGVIGPITGFNAEGREEVHRDQPQETAYRTAEWRWTEWHGRDEVEQSRFVDVPYKRYPRTFIEPPAIELVIGTDVSGEKLVTAQRITYDPRNEAVLLHLINLFLEIFHECEIFTADLEPIISAAVKRLNWTVLPAGRLPWATLRRHLTPVLTDAGKGTRVVVEHRLQVINDYGPEFAAVGTAGFHGYVILGFPKRDLYICESIYTGNATYVFGQNWETLSKLTKAEIIQGAHQRERIVHREGWERRIARLFSK